MVLAMGADLRILIDRWIFCGDPHLLDLALVAMMGIVVILALATFARFHLVSWLGKRVVADIRRTILIGDFLSPSFMKQAGRRSVVASVADTTVLQTARSDHRSRCLA